MSVSPNNNQKSRRLFVNNLAWATSDEELNTLFSKHLNFGTITECAVQRRDNQQSKGFAFVTFSSDQDATTAMYVRHYNIFVQQSPLTILFMFVTI